MLQPIKLVPISSSRIVLLVLSTVVAFSAAKDGSTTGPPLIPPRSQEKTFVYVADLEQKTCTCLSDARLPDFFWNGSPEWSHDGSRIVFDATPRDKEWRRSHIALYHVTGPKKGTTEDLGQGNAPTWSPDDSQVAFFLNPSAMQGAREGTWVMDADGGGREWLSPGWFPNWSPDGQSLLLNEKFGDPHGLLLYDTVAGTSRRLGRPFLDVDWQPAWSPDGKEFAVMCLGDQDKKGIVVFDRSGDWTSRRQVWPREDVEDRLPRDAVAAQIAWSPVEEQLLVRFDSPSEKWSRFFLMPADGSTPPQWIGENGLRIGEKGPPVFPLDVSWSPDGKQLVFVAKPPEEGSEPLPAETKTRSP